MASPPWIRIALGATTLMILALAVGVLRWGVPDGGANEGGAADDPFLDAPLAAPVLDLVSHHGDAWRLDAHRGSPAVVFFGYTHCPDVCPLTLARLSQVLDDLGDEAAGGLLPVFVTVDPARDDPARLAAYLEAFHPMIVGLTGPTPEVEAQAREFGVGIVVPPHEPGEPYLVDHTARTFLLDAEGRIVGSLASTASRAELHDAVVALLERER